MGRIQILSIDRDDVRIVWGTLLGYRAEFRTPLVTGYATIVPYGNRDKNLAAGNIISVETGQESVTNVVVLDHESYDQMTPTDQDGNYNIVGEVIQNVGDYVFDVKVGDLFFALDVEETGGLILRPGQWVTFNIQGLSFFDTAIILN